MDLLEQLDAFIEEAVVELYTKEQVAYLLLSEDFRFLTPGERNEKLLETVKRTRVKVAGGGYMTKRRIGRPNPRRSQIARRAAMKGKSKRRIAARSMKSKIKRRRTLQARKQLMGGARRGAHGTKRHGPPRRPVRRTSFRPRRRR
jgi:hypothetical protein